MGNLWHVYFLRIILYLKLMVIFVCFFEIYRIILWRLFCKSFTANEYQSKRVANLAQSVQPSMQIHLDKVRLLVVCHCTTRTQYEMRRALTVIAIAESSACNHIRDTMHCNYIV